MIEIPNRFDLPQTLVDDPIWGRAAFYSLPKELLEDVVNQVREPAFDAKVLEWDRAVSALSGDHSSIIGVQNGVPIQCDLLGRPLGVKSLLADRIADGTAKEAGFEWIAGASANAAEAEATIDWAKNVARGYAGWLSVNLTFVMEMRALLSEWQTSIAQWGYDPRLVTEESRSAEPHDPELTDFMTAITVFKRRWHLARIAGPYLVSPARPLIGLKAPASTATADVDQGAHFYLPAVFPLPNRDQLLAMMEGAMGRGRLPEHLDGWGKLIERHITARKSVTRYSQLFELQHWWMALYSRHSAALKGKKGIVEGVMARWFSSKKMGGPTPDGLVTVHKAITTIKKARGKGWDLLFCPPGI